MTNSPSTTFGINDDEMPPLKEVLDAFLQECWHINSSFDNPIEITTIQIGGLNPSTEDIVDWWPVDQIDKRAKRCGVLLESMNRGCGHYQDSASDFWGVKKGVLQTCEFLWQTRHNRDQNAAVWLAAALWSKKKRMPHSWYLGANKFINTICTKVLGNNGFVTKNAHLWHHASSAALPCEVINMHGQSLITPKTWRDIVYICAVEALYARATWRLINFIPLPQRSSRKRAQ